MQRTNVLPPRNAAPACPRVRDAEPLLGYRLLEPIGQCGFGEVWKCKAPGGALKAIKFICGGFDSRGGAEARPELDTLMRAKDVCHPYVLAIDRIEVVGGDLVVVMELAERNLQDVVRDCRARGLSGVPRDELLRYLGEAAEALDLMNSQHGLHHLDVKPRNLFLVGNHVKVADFGLVESLGELSASMTPSLLGITPLYAAPEVFQAKSSRHSDQYSLAIVYQELLTGTLPYQGRNARQLMLQHLTGTPSLDGLPEVDQPLVARALDREPRQRFPSCVEFIQALARALPSPPRAEGPRVRGEETSGSPHSSSLSPPGQGEQASPAAGFALPGYQFVEYLSQNPLGELWRVEGPDGRLRLAHCLSGTVPAGPEALAQLQALRHPALPAVEVLRGATGRVFLITEQVSTNLREQLQECMTEQWKGLPRDELLGYLRTVAEALDALEKQYGVSHLALSPRNLLLDGERLLVGDFGLVHLLWLPTGQPVGLLNQRYSAPELFEPGSHPASDQYSLALIYAELLTGVHPRPSRLPARATNGRSPNRLDLDHLPAPERAVVARATHPDPRQRFASCTEFVCALEAAGKDPQTQQRNRYEKLPTLVPVYSLHGKAVPVDLKLPTVEELVAQVVTRAAGALQVADHGGFRYLIHSGDVLEHHCIVRLFTGGLKLKLQGLREQWKACVVQRNELSFVCHIDTPRTLWQRCVGKQAGMEVTVQLRPREDGDAQLYHGVVRVTPINRGGQYKDRLREFGPLLLESVRAHLQAEPELRAQERWPIRHRLRVYPVFPDLTMGEVIEAEGKDVSLSGVGFQSSRPIPAERLYVQLATEPPGVEYAVLAQLIRSVPCEDGTLRIGAAFVLPPVT